MKFKSIKKISLYLGVTLMVLIGGITLSSSGLNYFEINKQLDIFANLFREINMSYVDDTEPGELMEDAIENMLRNLDPYTVYIPESDIENYRMMQTGQYGGVGATIMKRGDYVIITAPRKGYPADKAGLKAGDIVKKVEGKDMFGKSTEDVSGILKGSPGTKVQMTYERNGKEETIELEREDIQVKSVPFYGMIDENIAYIYLTSFTDKASKEVSEALIELKKEHEVRGLVFDLRGNPGGLLSEAVNVTNIFVEKGQEVVSTIGKNEENSRTYRTLKSPVDSQLPVVILINEQSASASEIVAGTIQDLDRGVVVGQRSYGKGLVQQTKRLSYGSQVKITIAKYYTPSGRCIQAINYAERDSNGKVKRLPDSLRTEFKTANGRKVYDGGGVDPDLSLEDENYPLILISLIRNNLIFDYVTDFCNNHDAIDEPGKFSLNDEDYSDFAKFLNDKEYMYTTETEKAYERLKETSEIEEYEGIDDEIEALIKAIHDSKNDDLEKFKTTIKAYLEEEIAQRYYYEEGRLQQRIASDPQVLRASDLLSNQDEYYQLLKVDGE